MSTLRSLIGCSLCVLLGPLFLLGCADDLPKATEIEHMRVIGTSLQVVGDEARATPRPGERVRVALATVLPSLAVDDDDDSHTPRVFLPQGDRQVLPTLSSRERQVHSLLYSCTAPTRYTGGIPICQELIDAASSGDSAEQIQERFGMIFTGLADIAAGGGADAGVDPRMPCAGMGTISQYFGGALSGACAQGAPTAELVVPKDYRRDRLLFSGVVCERGNVRIDENAAQPLGCADADVEPLYVHGLIPVEQKPADRNLNPPSDPSVFQVRRLGNSNVREGAGPWLPVDPALSVMNDEQDCAAVARKDDPRLPILVGHLDMRLLYRADARERFEGKPEQLEITVYTTRGEVERRYTLFDPDDHGLNVSAAEIALPGDDGVGDDDDESSPGDSVKWLSETLRYTPPKFETAAHTKKLPDGAKLEERGKLVRFYVTVRDQRGGFGVNEYALCVDPPQ